ncbi:hypothetical protein GIB67_009646, partial [Kingdonia uniflora]
MTEQKETIREVEGYFGDYDDECAKLLDKGGKEYFINTVEYEQARKWVLPQAAKNFEWEEVSIEESVCSFDAVTNLRYINLAKLQGNSEDNDEPYILTSQTTQVIYCKDHSRPDGQWHVVLDFPKRLSKDVNAYEDPLIFVARINVEDSILSLVDDVAEALSTLVQVTMSPIASFLVFMSYEDGSSMGTSLESSTTQWKEYRPRGLQAPRDYKSRLKTNNYDAYETDEERKSKRHKGVNKEDWIEFLDRLSTSEEQAKCKKGKAARSKMHSPHMTGRLGASEKKEILEKGGPKASVKRYVIFMACHTKEDGTYPEEMKERMVAIQKDPMLMDKDLDNDVVAV